MPEGMGFTAHSLNTAMRAIEIITEGVRPGHLYHGTTVDNLYEILEHDRIEAKTGHRIDAAWSENWGFRPSDPDNRGYVHGVSLTRSLAFARRWGSRHPAWSKTPLWGVVLVLDGARLSARHRMLPVSFWLSPRSKPVDELARSNMDESEEFVIGAIAPLRPYLVEIQVAEALLPKTLLPFAAEEYRVKVTTY